VPGEHQPLAVGCLRTDGDEQIGLGAVGRCVALDADAGAIEVVGEEIRQRQVALSARTVEADQPGEQRAIVERGR
jgi:hypothetical protein